MDARRAAGDLGNRGAVHGSDRIGDRPEQFEEHPCDSEHPGAQHRRERDSQLQRGRAKADRGHAKRHGQQRLRRLAYGRAYAQIQQREFGCPWTFTAMPAPGAAGARVRMRRALGKVHICSWLTISTAAHRDRCWHPNLGLPSAHVQSTCMTNPFDGHTIDATPSYIGVFHAQRPPPRRP